MAHIFAKIDCESQKVLEAYAFLSGDSIDDDDVNFTVTLINKEGFTKTSQRSSLSIMKEPKELWARESATVTIRNIVNQEGFLDFSDERQQKRGANEIVNAYLQAIFRLRYESPITA